MDEKLRLKKAPEEKPLHSWHHNVLGHIALSSEELRFIEETAAKAMQAMCAGEGARMVADRDKNYSEEKGNWAEVVAMNAFNFADAMFLERNKRMYTPKK